ncbi:MAG: hypothetical protein L6Q74_06945 [Sphaerotilus natans subsp. sulfidivorans]|uniref:hypothetical protein n=1 Tax=Sphaerotilus sulfidivorans TaxID=639200 RepID=UPI002352DE01|nr:hypothetical protein [Sphaerotilus sulfidivorans]MCK6401629.1 hypothetical protein [Sphaerotilus sulfidivorans]
MTMTPETIAADAVLTSEQFAEVFKIPAHELADLVLMGIVPSRGTLQQMSGAYLGVLQRRKDHLCAAVDAMKAGDKQPDSMHARLSLSQHLDFPCTQEQFGRLVDLSQAAVSGLIKRGILRPDGTALTWWRDYVRHLEDEGRARRAGRGA